MASMSPSDNAPMSAQAPQVESSSSVLSKTELKSRGWSEALIERFLGPADGTAPNPWYKCAAPMCLYCEERVIGVEQTLEFQTAMQKTEARRRSAQAAAARRRRTTLDEAERLEIQVPVLAWDQLVQRACDSYNDRQWSRHYADDPEPVTPDDDVELIHRLVVNYLRHELTHYDSYLAGNAGQVGRVEANLVIKSRVLNAIADAYPNVAMECRRQQQRAEEAYHEWVALRNR